MTMKIERALYILKREKEFLGITYEELFELCRAESATVLLSTLDAYDAYVEWHEEDPGIGLLLAEA